MFSRNSWAALSTWSAHSSYPSACVNFQFRTTKLEVSKCHPENWDKHHQPFPSDGIWHQRIDHGGDVSAVLLRREESVGRPVVHDHAQDVTPDELQPPDKRDVIRQLVVTRQEHELPSRLHELESIPGKVHLGGYQSGFVQPIIEQSKNSLVSLLFVHRVVEVVGAVAHRVRVDKRVDSDDRWLPSVVDDPLGNFQLQSRWQESFPGLPGALPCRVVASIFDRGGNSCIHRKTGKCHRCYRVKCQIGHQCVAILKLPSVIEPCESPSFGVQDFLRSRIQVKSGISVYVYGDDLIGIVAGRIDERELQEADCIFGQWMTCCSECFLWEQSLRLNLEEERMRYLSVDRFTKAVIHSDNRKITSVQFRFCCKLQNMLAKIVQRLPLLVFFFISTFIFLFFGFNNWSLPEDILQIWVHPVQRELWKGSLVNSRQPMTLLSECEKEPKKRERETRSSSVVDSASIRKEGYFWQVFLHEWWRQYDWVIEKVGIHVSYSWKESIKEFIGRTASSFLRFNGT